MAARAPFLRRQARVWGAVLALVLIAGIGALIWHGRAEPDRPALWRISRGAQQGWILGTIHVVPSGANWLSQPIRAAIGRSGQLVIEVSGLAEERKDQAVFERLGRSSSLPALADRLEPAEQSLVRQIAPNLARPLDGYEDWAAALLIAAAANARAHVNAAEAPEAVLEHNFRRAGKPVLGLETIAEQLGRFDQLQQADQRALLIQAVREADDAAMLFETLYQSWATGDLAALQRQFLATLSQSPELQAALFDEPNARWTDKIDLLMAGGARPVFIAVGAGHLVGPSNLLDRLAARGWKIKRVQ
jgi:uncharacterized protein YbaP (TraB family)